MPAGIRARRLPPPKHFVIERRPHKMILTQEDLEFLKQLRGAGERGRTIRTRDTGAALLRLVKGGYVIDRTTGRNLIQFRITRRGDDALAEHA
jgi:hypothetical protein